MANNEETPKEIQEQTRIYNFEINFPSKGKKSMIFRREKLYISNNEIVHQTQIEPLIKDYGTIARDIITVFDPITNQNVTLSVVSLVNAIQMVGNKV